MIITGDVAVSPVDRFNFVGFEELRDTAWCINLEGPILSVGKARPMWGVYNSEALLESFQGFTLGPIFAANNHIHDTPQGVAETLEWARKNGLNLFGVGLGSPQAMAPAFCNSGADKFLMIGFGWEVIGCHAAEEHSPGVNRLIGSVALSQLLTVRAEHPDVLPVVIIHGNYEFERYPQPGHRKLAKAIIDAGAYAVIFHHPHIVSPVECYKDRTIAYSLGNWAFSYGKFFGGQHKFPESSFHQIAVELSTLGDKIHHAMFEPPTTVRYLKSELVSCNDFSLKPEFEGFDDKQYLEWFRKNRVKRKGLPIYKSADASISNSLKNSWVKIRQLLIDNSVRLGIKKMSRGSSS